MKEKANYPKKKKNPNNKIELFLAFRRKAKMQAGFKLKPTIWYTLHLSFAKLEHT